MSTQTHSDSNDILIKNCLPSVLFPSLYTLQSDMGSPLAELKIQCIDNKHLQSKIMPRPPVAPVNTPALHAKQEFFWTEYHNPS